jgi:hypothetical protein
MKIPTTGQNSGQLFLLQSRIVEVTDHNKPNGPFVSPEKYCCGEPKWNFEFCDYITYRSDRGDDFKVLYAELSKSWAEKTVSGFYSFGSAELAKEIMEKASQNGEFDHRDGYWNLLYRVRHEYRIVSVEFDIKTTVC